jgi:phosphoglycolate phosphatase
VKTKTSTPFDSILFDLDGTLWDTCQVCAIAWNNVVRRNGISFRLIYATDVRAVKGKPHETCIRETFAGLPEDALKRIILGTVEEDNRIVREMGGELFPGVGHGLRKLHRDYPLFIVSNCQDGYIQTFLEFTRFKPLFKDFECWGKTGKTKSENLKSLILRNGLKNPLMVGDSDGDHQAAKDCGVPFAFAEYGFGVCKNADFDFKHFDELTGFVSKSVMERDK